MKKFAVGFGSVLGFVIVSALFVYGAERYFSQPVVEKTWTDKQVVRVILADGSIRDSSWLKGYEGTYETVWVAPTHMWKK